MPRLHYLNHSPQRYSSQPKSLFGTAAAEGAASQASEIASAQSTDAVQTYRGYFANALWAPRSSTRMTRHLHLRSHWLFTQSRSLWRAVPQARRIRCAWLSMRALRVLPARTAPRLNAGQSPWHPSGTEAHPAYPQHTAATRSRYPPVPVPGGYLRTQQISSRAGRRRSTYGHCASTAHPAQRLRRAWRPDVAQGPGSGAGTWPWARPGLWLGGS